MTHLRKYTTVTLSWRLLSWTTEMTEVLKETTKQLVDHQHSEVELRLKN